MSKRRLSVIPAAAILDQELNLTCLRVLGQIGSHTDNNGWCFPRQNVIAEALGIGRPAVNRAIQRLVEKGYVEVRHRYRDDGGQMSNLYRVVLDPPAEPGDSDLNPVSAREQGCISSDTPPCIGTSTGGESVAGTPGVSAGDTPITSHPNESKDSQDARACSDTPPGDDADGPRELDPGQKALHALRAEIGEARFASWFANVRIELPPARDGPALVTAPTALVADRVRRDFAETLERLLGRRIDVVAHAVRPPKAMREGRRKV